MSRKNGREIPEQDFLEPVHWMFCDAIENVAHVELRVESVELRVPSTDHGRSTLAIVARPSGQFLERVQPQSCPSVRPSSM
jgi:hypothetical protein